MRPPTVATVLLTCSAIVLAGCSDPDGPTAVPTPLPDPVGSPTSLPPPTGAPSAPGTPPPDAAPQRPEPGVVDLSMDAFVLGFTPDGTGLWVSAPDPDGVGCEEGPRYSLQVHDLRRGTTVRALDDASTGLTSPLVREDGSYLLTSSCEGFLAAARIAEARPDGTLALGDPVTLPDGDTGYQEIQTIVPEPGTDHFLLSQTLASGPHLRRVDARGEVLDEVPIATEVYELVAADDDAYGVVYEEADGFVGSVVELWSGTTYTGYDVVRAGPTPGSVLLSGDAGVALVSDGELTPWVVDDDELEQHGDTVVVGDAAFAISDRFGLAALVAVGQSGEGDALATGVASSTLFASSLGQLVYGTMSPPDDGEWAYVLVEP